MTLKQPHAATAEAFKKRKAEIEAQNAEKREEFGRIKAKERKRILAEIEAARVETIRRRAEMEVRQELRAEGLL